ncbi:hypothetical protein D3C84_625800 [compost metagenome]
MKLRGQHLAHRVCQVQVFYQLLGLAAQARNVRQLGIAYGPNRCIGLWHRQLPERLLAVAHRCGNGLVTAHGGLNVGFDQQPFGDIAHELQLALAVAHHGLDGQRLQVQIVLAFLQFALQQLVILTTGEYQADGESGEKTQDHRASRVCASHGQEQARSRRGR